MMSCFAGNTQPAEQTAITTHQYPTANKISPSVAPSGPAPPDESPLGRKATRLLNQLRAKGDYTACYGIDSLIDMNGDGYKDLLVECYGASGTGFKYGATIFLFDRRKNQFRHQRINLPNPTFYFDRKIITAYYVGLGGGYAYTLQWKGAHLDTLEYIDAVIHNKREGFTFSFERRDAITGHITHSAVDNMIDLPPEYRYAEYRPLISRTPY
ncbi:hypothetical protein [Taibaiella koreensis]|uniref:hypothetical protein n=1 Tax=Taibaiella koreensis TaxID=1268548 RepID=UPI0013C2D6EE|nr:hypothetical protein [Taibaiella koreensis]